MSIASKAAAAVRAPPVPLRAPQARTGQVVFFRSKPDKPRLTAFQQRAARRVTELSRIYHAQFPKGLPRNTFAARWHSCRTTGARNGSTVMRLG